MSRSDGRFGGRLPEIVAAVLVLIPGLVVTAVLALIVAILAAALPASAAGMAGTVFSLVVAIGVIGTLVLATLAWIAVSRARREVRPRAEDTRVAWYRRARKLESLVPPAGSLGLSDRLEPDEETIVAALRRKYVSGEIDEHRFERELERLLGHGADVSVTGAGTVDPSASGSEAVAGPADGPAEAGRADGTTEAEDRSVDRQLDG